MVEISVDGGLTFHCSIPILTKGGDFFTLLKTLFWTVVLLPPCGVSSHFLHFLFLKQLCEACYNKNWPVHVYVLMRKNFRLVLETPMAEK